MGGIISMHDLPGVKQNFNPATNKVIRMSDIEDRGKIMERKIQSITNRKIKDVFVQGQWKGKRCFIVAGGESVHKFDLKKLEGEHTIAVNLAFRLFEPEIIYGMDARLWGWIENDETGKGDCERFDKSKAIKVWSDVALVPLPEDIVLAPNIGRPGLSEDINEGLGAGTNSGFGALNLALLLGASEIYLIGYDFKGGRWHEGYPAPSETGNDYHRQCFEENVEAIKKFGAKIINLNPDSALKIFEFGKMPSDLREKREPPKEEVVERVKAEGEPVFVSYYTKGNGYDAYAKDLEKSMKKFQLDYDIQAVKDRGKWDVNTKLKPAFVLKMMERYPGRPIIWVDADALFVRFPEYMFDIKEDIGVHYYRNGRELISNLVYFSGTDGSKAILRRWMKLCNDPNNEATWDQLLLQKLLDEMKVEVNKLPPEYCYILLGKNPVDIDPVVEQRQASRKLKK